MLIVSQIKSYVSLAHPLFAKTAKLCESRNYPVNLDHVTWIESDAHIYDANNHPKPAIVFHFVHQDSVTWAGYETEEQRDNAVQAIQMKMKSAEISHL